MELYPGWYEVKILHVYEDNTCNVEFFHDEGSPNAIVPFSKLEEIRKKRAIRRVSVVVSPQRRKL